MEPSKKEKPQTKPEESKNKDTQGNQQNHAKTSPAVVLTIILAIAALLYMLNPQAAADDHTVKAGDKVHINFVQKLEDGTVIDTSYEDIAKESGIIKDSYPPLIFIVGKGQVPKGLENALVGMKVGDRKTITLAPKDAYGEYKKELAVVAERIQYKERNIEMSNYESLSSARFTEIFQKDVAFLGDHVSTWATPWNYTIVDIKPDNITLKAIITEGATYRLPDTVWNSTAVEVTDSDTTFRQDPPDGMKVNTQLGEAAVTTTEDKIKLTINPEIGDIYYLSSMPARVTAINETHITLDANQELAGKTIIFEIELLQRTVSGIKTESGI